MGATAVDTPFTRLRHRRFRDVWTRSPDKALTLLRQLSDISALYQTQGGENATCHRPIALPQDVLDDPRLEQLLMDCGTAEVPAPNTSDSEDEEGGQAGTGDVASGDSASSVAAAARAGFAPLLMEVDVHLLYAAVRPKPDEVVEVGKV